MGYAILASPASNAPTNGCHVGGRIESTGSPPGNARYLYECLWNDSVLIRQGQTVMPAPAAL